MNFNGSKHPAGNASIILKQRGRMKELRDRTVKPFHIKDNEFEERIYHRDKKAWFSSSPVLVLKATKDGKHLLEKKYRDSDEKPYSIIPKGALDAWLAWAGYNAKGGKNAKLQHIAAE